MTLKTNHLNETPAVKPDGLLPSRFGFLSSLSRYWPLVLGIGFFFGWLLSFPMQGPALGALIEKHDLDLTTLLIWFLIGHILGLACAGIAGYFQRRYLAWFTLAAITIAGLTLTFSAINPAAWPLVLGLMGFFAGFVVIGWGAHFVWLVEPAQRGRTFILGAILANLILYLVNLTLGHLAVEIVMILLGLMTLVLPVILITRCRGLVVATPNIPAKESAGSVWVRLRIGTYLIFIFAIYTVAGLLYAVLPDQSIPSSGFLPYYALIPYILFLLVAGLAADKLGRRLNAILGVAVIGSGLISAVLIKGDWQYFIVQTLVLGGYAFLDTFTWVLAADLAGRRRPSTVYAAVLCTNLLAVLAGVFLAMGTGKLDSSVDTIIIGLTGMFILVSVFFVLSLRDPHQKAVSAGNEAMTSIISTEALVKKSGLTPREADIAALLIAGASTQEILAKLVIAPDTLKSHLRNLYRKVGARNRVEFTLAVLKESRSSSAEEK